MTNDLARDLYALIEAALRGTFGEGAADPLVEAVATRIAEQVAAEVSAVAQDMSDDVAAGVFTA
jgi:hypothetical protein